MDEREAIRHWVRTWKEAAPELASIRRREIRDAENLAVLTALESAFNHAAHSLPPRPTSGLVEMQRWFAKLRK